MKKIILLTLIMFSIIGVHAQSIIIHDGNRIDCGTAETTYEISVCVAASYEAKVKEYVKITNIINKCIDKQIVEDSLYALKYPDDVSSNQTNFKEVKRLFNLTNDIFIKLVDLERDLEYELHVGGTFASIEATIMAEELYIKRIEILSGLIKNYYCQGSE